jgi:hypothetical protein
MKLKVDIDKLNVDSGFVDVRRWFNRYELYIDAQRPIKEVKEGETATGDDRLEKETIYLRYLPLHLTGSILCCFEELEEADSRNYPKVKELLISYYSTDRSTAYNRFVESKYTGTGIDLYIAEMRKYLGVLGIRRESQDPLLLEQFLRSIPESCAMELRSRCGKEGDEMELSAVTQVARTLRSLQLDDRGKFVGLASPGSVVAGKGRDHRRPSRPSQDERKAGKNPAKTVACFACNGEHRMSDCPIMQAFRASGNASGPLSPAGSGMGPSTNPVQH